MHHRVVPGIRVTVELWRILGIDNGVPADERTEARVIFASTQVNQPGRVLVATHERFRPDPRHGVPDRIAVRILVPLGRVLGGGVVDRDGAGAVRIAREKLQTAGGALGDRLAVEGVIPLRRLDTSGGKPQFDVTDVERGSVLVVGDDPVAVGVIDVAVVVRTVGEGRYWDRTSDLFRVIKDVRPAS
jgi:hypothetical protein